MTDEEFKRYQDIARAGYRMAHSDEFCTCKPMERMAAQGKAMVEAAKYCPLCKKAPEPYMDDVELPSDAPVFDPKTTVHFVPEAKLLEAQERITQLERERDEARERATAMHRRAQKAEGERQRLTTYLFGLGKGEVVYCMAGARLARWVFAEAILELRRTQKDRDEWERRAFQAAEEAREAEERATKAEYELGVWESYGARLIRERDQARRFAAEAGNPVPLLVPVSVEESP